MTQASAQWRRNVGKRAKRIEDGQSFQYADIIGMHKGIYIHINLYGFFYVSDSAEVNIQLHRFVGSWLQNIPQYTTCVSFLCCCFEIGFFFSTSARIFHFIIDSFLYYYNLCIQLLTRTQCFHRAGGGWGFKQVSVHSCVVVMQQCQSLSDLQLPKQSTLKACLSGAFFFKRGFSKKMFA